MRLSSASVALAAFALTIAPARAAPATAEQAQVIKGALERYLGSGGDPGGSPVAVKPEGDAYAVDVDVKKALHATERFGVDLAPLSYRLTLLPQDGGTWRVTNRGTTRITAKLGERTISVVTNNAQFDGVFDPAIPSFTRSTSSYDSMSVAGFGGKGGTQTRDVQGGKASLTAEAVADGRITGHLVQSSTSSQQDVAIDALPSSEHFVLKSGPTTEDGHVDNLEIRALMDLWAFFVTHPSEAAIKADQEPLRALMRKALPIFTTLSQGASFERVAVESPVGAFAAQSASVRLDVSGLVANGHVGSAIKVDGLAIPSGLVPPWAQGLVPTRVEVAESLSGYHLDTLAQEAVSRFDLNGKEPFPPDTQDKLKTLFGPLEQIVLTLAPSRIVSPLLDVRIEGQGHWKQPIPDFALKVAVTGMDKAVQDIQAKAGKDQQAAQLIAALLVAKGYGKAEPDGSLSWDVKPDASGTIIVNGVALPFGKK